MEDLSNAAAPSEHLLDDVEYTLHQANPGRRFANYLIDLGTFWLICAI